MRSMSHHGYASASSCLPGFSGRFDDASAAGSGGTRVADASVDELADLSILGARLQKEKLRIHEAARARRRALEEVSKPSLCSRLVASGVFRCVLFSSGMYLCLDGTVRPKIVQPVRHAARGCRG